MARTNLRRFAAATAGMLVMGAAPVTGAMASEATDGTLDWGVKESFRSYVVSPAAGGDIEVDGASENADGSFRFGGGTGAAGEGSADLTFSGSVRFTGHDGALDLTISDPGVRIDGSGGSLIADVSSLGQDGEVSEYSDVVVADLDLSGVSLDADADGVVTVSGVPATLSSAGAPAFGGFYEAGEALDPVSFTVETSGEGDSAQGGDGADAAAGSEDALPETGAPWQLVAVGGLALVALGATFVLLGRRSAASGGRP